MRVFVCFKQKSAYEMRISDWSSDVCSSDLFDRRARRPGLRSDRQRDAAFAPAPFGNARRHVVAPGNADAFCSVIDLRLERADKIGSASRRATVCQYV